MSQKNELQNNAFADYPQAIASFTGIRYQYEDCHTDVPAPSEITLQALRKLNYLGSTSTAMIRREALMHSWRVRSNFAKLPGLGYLDKVEADRRLCNRT